MDAKGNMIIQPSFIEKSIRGRRMRYTHHRLESYRRALEAVCLYFGMDLPATKMPVRLLPYHSAAEPWGLEEARAPPRPMVEG